MKQINISFGSRGMALAIVRPNLLLLLNLPGQTKCQRAAGVIGLQRCGKVWIFGKNLQVSSCHLCVYIQHNIYSLMMMAR